MCTELQTITQDDWFCPLYTMPCWCINVMRPAINGRAVHTSPSSTTRSVTLCGWERLTSPTLQPGSKPSRSKMTFQTDSNTEDNLFTTFLSQNTHVTNSVLYACTGGRTCFSCSTEQNTFRRNAIIGSSVNINNDRPPVWLTFSGRHGTGAWMDNHCTRQAPVHQLALNQCHTVAISQTTLHSIITVSKSLLTQHGLHSWKWRENCVKSHTKRVIIYWIIVQCRIFDSS